MKSLLVIIGLLLSINSYGARESCDHMPSFDFLLKSMVICEKGSGNPTFTYGDHAGHSITSEAQYVCNENSECEERGLSSSTCRADLAEMLSRRDIRFKNYVRRKSDNKCKLNKKLLNLAKNKGITSKEYFAESRRVREVDMEKSAMSCTYVEAQIITPRNGSCGRSSACLGTIRCVDKGKTTYHRNKQCGAVSKTKCISALKCINGGPGARPNWLESAISVNESGQAASSSLSE